MRPHGHTRSTLFSTDSVRKMAVHAVEAAVPIEGRQWRRWVHPPTPAHSHRIRGRCLIPRPGNAIPIRGSGSKRVSVPFKVGSRPGLSGVTAPLLADLIGIRRLRTEGWAWCSGRAYRL